MAQAIHRHPSRIINSFGSCKTIIKVSALTQLLTGQLTSRMSSYDPTLGLQRLLKVMLFDINLPYIYTFTAVLAIAEMTIPSMGHATGASIARRYHTSVY